jgi:myo-inositol-1(or 4)-monophosphatase
MGPGSAFARAGRDDRDPRTYAIIGAALEVYNQLGPGFPEAVYEAALCLEFERCMIPFVRQPDLHVYYRGCQLAPYFRVDFVCYGSILVELKALPSVGKMERTQVLNYLKATGFELGLLLNFGGSSLYPERVANTWKTPSSQSAKSAKSASPAGGAYGPEVETAKRLAHSGASVLMAHWGRVLRTERKSDGSIVTEADLEAERTILGRLREVFPEDAVSSEECGDAGAPSNRLWVVDPLDGTTNFSRGLPFFAVSVALWEGGVPVAAAVCLPAFEETFAATIDGPAMLNDEEIRVSEVESASAAMVNAYFDRHGRLEDGLEVFRRVALACEGRVKVMGSTASLLCYVACGRLDGFVRNWTKVWDFAAGALILRQAGGRATDFDEQPLVRTGQSLLATNGRIHAALAKVTRGD